MILRQKPCSQAPVAHLFLRGGNPRLEALPRQESFASLHILTRRASEGSEALPSLARRVRMSFFGARVKWGGAASSSLKQLEVGNVPPVEHIEESHHATAKLPAEVIR